VRATTEGHPGGPELEPLRGREPVGLQEAYRRFGRSLYGTALRLLRRREDAEDAMQDTFLAFHRTRPALPADQAEPWLRRVLVNRCLDRLRRGRRWRALELSDGPSGGAAPAGYLRVDLERAVARLPEGARLVFVLHDVEGFKHREIGEIMGLSEGTTKSQLSRARSLLRELLDGGER
jgi:RNA polymerase sigma-70 factor (ECF subfamily)